MANDERSSGPGIRPPAVIAVLAIALGFTSIALAWYHAGNTPDVWVQNQELISGGIGGLGLILLGVGMLVYDGIVASRAATARRWDRLIGLLERDESADPTLPLSLLQATEASEERRHHRVAAR